MKLYIGMGLEPRAVATERNHRTALICRWARHEGLRSRSGTRLVSLSDEAPSRAVGVNSSDVSHAASPAEKAPRVATVMRGRLSRYTTAMRPALISGHNLVLPMLTKRAASDVSSNAEGESDRSSRIGLRCLAGNVPTPHTAGAVFNERDVGRLTIV